MEDDSEVRQSLLGARRATPNRSQEGRSEMETVDFDEVLSKVGGFGRYQKTFYFLLCLPAMFTATITLANTFITAEPQTRCDIPFCDDKYMPQYDDAFVAPHHFANYTIPLSEDGTHFSTCKYYKPVMNLTKESFILSRSEKISYTTTSFSTSPRIYQCNASNFNQSVERYCTKYVYDQSIYTSTVVSEWNLVCNDSWKVPLIESMYFAGVMVGAPVFGVLADMYGRKPILMISIAMTTLFGIPLGFSPNYNIFIVLQFFVAIGQMGIFQTCFIMAIELVTKEKRVFCGIAIEYFFDIGAVFLAGIAYALRDWKYILLTATCPVGLFLMYWPIVPESVRWLLVNKKFTEAKIEIHRISKWNGRPFDVSSLGRQRGSTRSTNIPSIPTNQISVGSLNNTDSVYENNEAIDSSRITFRPENNITSRQGSNGNNNAVMRTHEKETFITFLRDPVMFIRHVNVCYCWFVVTLVYYGLSMVSRCTFVNMKLFLFKYKGLTIET
jgi:OCT family organic cation transporter-like MFS transporter 4/5